MHLHRTTKRQGRWREACVDGVLHVAYAAALKAESAAQRCTPARSRRKRRPHPLRKLARLR
jgi:hypothetical protein